MDELFSCLTKICGGIAPRLVDHSIPGSCSQSDETAPPGACSCISAVHAHDLASRPCCFPHERMRVSLQRLFFNFVLIFLAFKRFVADLFFACL